MLLTWVWMFMLHISNWTVLNPPPPMSEVCHAGVQLVQSVAMRYNLFQREMKNVVFKSSSLVLVWQSFSLLKIVNFFQMWRKTAADVLLIISRSSLSQPVVLYLHSESHSFTRKHILHLALCT